MSDLKPFDEFSAEHLRLVLETGRIGIWELDLASGKAIRNAWHDELFGYEDPLAEWNYADFLDHVVPEDRDRVDALRKAAIASRQPWTFETAIIDNRQRKRWISAAGRPIEDESGKVGRLIGHVIDITASREREHRLQLITEELNHRVRNMLSMIKSIVRLSSRRAEDLPTFATSLEGRVSALARSHQLLVGGDADLRTPTAILDAEFAAYPGVRERLDLDAGGEVPLGASAAQGLALVLHELTTNALKYGSLSNDDGRVRFVVTREGEDLLISWCESGGPPVRVEHDNGFGSRLIADAIGAKGEVDLRFAQSGVECDIRMPVD